MSNSATTENAASRTRLSVLVPVYNEERTILRVLTKVLALGDLVHEVIVVDDGSVDETARIVEHLAAQDPRIRLHRMATNRGKTAAICHAFGHVTGDIAIIQDADTEYDPQEIPDVVAPILEEQADVVYGSRFLVRRASRVLYFYHYLANRLLTFLSNLLTNRNMTDVETGFKAFRSEIIRSLELSSSGFGMEVELTALICMTDAKTYEVPVSYYGRTYSEGKKIGTWDGVMALWYILYFNLFKRFSPSTRRYVRDVNAQLRDIHLQHASAAQLSIPATDQPEPAEIPREEIAGANPN